MIISINGNGENALNYWPISPTTRVCELVEKTTNKHMEEFLHRVNLLGEEACVQREDVTL